MLAIALPAAVLCAVRAGPASPNMQSGRWEPMSRNGSPSTAMRSDSMLSITLSTVAFFVAGYLIKRYLDDIGIAPGLTRSVVVFVLAAAVAYAVAAAIDWLVA